MQNQSNLFGACYNHSVISIAMQLIALALINTNCLFQWWRQRQWWVCHFVTVRSKMSGPSGIHRHRHRSFYIDRTATGRSVDCQPCWISCSWCYRRMIELIMIGSRVTARGGGLANEGLIANVFYLQFLGRENGAITLCTKPELHWLSEWRNHQSPQSWCLIIASHFLIQDVLLELYPPPSTPKLMESHATPHQWA